MMTPLLSVVIVLALTLTALGQDDPSARETLRGLAGVNVIIEDLPLEAERAGLTRATVQSRHRSAAARGRHTRAE